MKSKLVLACTVVVLSLCLFGCSPNGSIDTDINVSCDDFREQNCISREVEVTADSSFIVTLCSNPTTGFQWESATIGDGTMLEQLDRKTVSPDSDPPPPPGAPGQEVWTFKALKKGETTISMDYSRPWEEGEKAARTFTLTVVVK